MKVGSILIKGDEEEKEARVNWLMNALSASPEQRDVRVHDGPILWKITMTPEGQRVMMAIDNQIYGRCDPPPQPECIHSDSECGDMYGWEAPCPPYGYSTCYDDLFPCPS